MGALGKILARYAPLFAERGFDKKPGEAAGAGSFFADNKGRFVSYDRMKGGDIRCFLGICSNSAMDSEPGIEAETRWWDTQQASTLESAVASSWEHLLECGFRFLDDPLELTPTEWRERYGLLVRDTRLRTMVISWPAAWHLNDVVIRSKRCIPGFTSLGALELHQRLKGHHHITAGSLPLANALELQQVIEVHGFSVRILLP
jgi:hypothetical protein